MYLQVDVPPLLASSAAGISDSTAAGGKTYISIDFHSVNIFCRPKGNKGTGEIQPVFNGRTEIPRFFDDHTEHRDSDRTAHNTGEIKQSKHRKSGFRRRLRNPLIS